MEIRRYRHEDWPAVQAFLRAHWRASHPFTQPEIFRWQLAGFGGVERPVSRLIRREGEILGFLGAIPGPYLRDGEIVAGVAFDVWIVRRDVRNLALGLLLMKSAEDVFEVCCSLGVNRDIAHYYTRRGYQYCEALHRWIAPLDIDACRRLAAPAMAGQADDAGTLAELAAEREKAAPSRPSAAVEPNHEIDPEMLAALYQRTAAQVLRFGLHRTAEFWDWRYRRSAGYRYLTFGYGPAGAVVARVEDVGAQDRPGVDGSRVLRLIELLPGRGGAWNGEPDEAFAALLSSVVHWAREQGCALADFQHSSDRLSRLLHGVGFVEQTPAAPPAIRAVPHLFQPLRHDVPGINLVFRTSPSQTETNAIDPRDTYFVKSDAGMDRPNVLPAPRGED